MKSIKVYKVKSIEFEKMIEIIEKEKFQFYKYLEKENTGFLFFVKDYNLFL